MPHGNQRVRKHPTKHPIASGPIRARNPSPQREGLENPGQKGDTSAAGTYWTVDSVGGKPGMLSRCLPPALGIRGTWPLRAESQEQALREFTEAEVVSNNVNTKQVFWVEAGGDEITAKVIRVCSTWCCGQQGGAGP